MRDSVPSPKYSAICNVLRQWKTSLIPTYDYSSKCLYRPMYVAIVQPAVVQAKLENEILSQVDMHSRRVNCR